MPAASDAAESGSGPATRAMHPWRRACKSLVLRRSEARRESRGVAVPQWVRVAHSDNVRVYDEGDQWKTEHDDIGRARWEV